MQNKQGINMSTKENVSCKTYRKRGHPQNSGGLQRWEETDIADTLTIFDNTDARTPILIVQKVSANGTGSIFGFGESSPRQPNQNQG
jgi:hypothetical protein